MLDHDLTLALIRCCGPLSVAELACRSAPRTRRVPGGYRVSDSQVADVVQRLIVAQLAVGIPHGTVRLYDTTSAGRLRCAETWARDHVEVAR